MATRRRLRRLAVCLALALGVLVVCLWVTQCVSARSLKAEIEAALPEGTPRDKIEAWAHSRCRNVCHILRREDKRVVGLGGEIPQSWIDLISPFPSRVRFEIHWDEDERRTTVSTVEINYLP
jgi:hypothetical protein